MTLRSVTGPSTGWPSQEMSPAKENGSLLVSSSTVRPGKCSARRPCRIAIVRSMFSNRENGPASRTSAMLTRQSNVSKPEPGGQTRDLARDAAAVFPWHGHAIGGAQHPDHATSFAKASAAFRMSFRTACSLAARFSE